MFYWKTLNEFRFVVAIVAALGISACSSNKDDAFDQRGTAPEGKHEVFKGPLYQAYRSVQESNYRTQCDQKLSEIQSTLIAALDLKSGEILKSALVHKNHPENYLPFVKSYLVNTPKKTPRAGWQDEPYSWNLIYDFYSKNVSSNTPEFWTTVDAYVRSLITDDRKRVVYGYNLSLNHDQVEKLSSLKEVAEACKTDTRCAQPRWSEDQLTMINAIPSYQHYQEALTKARFFKDQRKNMEKLFNRINDDFDLHREEYNNMVTHRKTDGKHIYSIPLDASSFAESDRSLLEKTITSIWSNESNSIDISWKISSAATSFFHFLFELEPNNRSYVNFALKEIHLFPYTAIRTVAHEFGHVLGFDDHYYTIWDPEKCEYHAQYNEEDLMSGSETGDVTGAEWQSLFEQYGNR